MVDAAAEALARGEVVALPTDTVYGLAVVASRPAAAAALARLKGRGADVPIQVLVAGLEQADALAGPDGLRGPARRLAERFWPGGLTVVVPRRAGVQLDVGGDGTTVGLRCPATGLVRALCRRVGPLAATSANRHGAPPLPTAAAVREAFGAALAVVVDGGACTGLASTVVDLTGPEPVCRREGAVPWQAVLDELG